MFTDVYDVTYISKSKGFRGNFIYLFISYMFLLILVLTPLIGIFIISAVLTYNITPHSVKLLKATALGITIVDLIISLIIFILFDSSSKQFQFLQEHYKVSYFDIYLGIDGLSIYFVLLTTIIMPISLISN